MADSSAILADFKRYTELIRAELTRGPVAPALAREETGKEIFVERGIVYPQVVLDPKKAGLSPAEKLIELSGFGSPWHLCRSSIRRIIIGPFTPDC